MLRSAAKHQRRLVSELEFVQSCTADSSPVPIPWSIRGEWSGAQCIVECEQRLRQPSNPQFPPPNCRGSPSPIAWWYPSGGASNYLNLRAFRRAPTLRNSQPRSEPAGRRRSASPKARSLRARFSARREGRRMRPKLPRGEGAAQCEEPGCRPAKFAFGSVRDEGPQQ